VSEVRRRLERYYWPYHQHLRKLLEIIWQVHGRVYHLNCHSMPGVSPPNSPEGPGVTRADIVLGDRDGSTCDEDYTHFVDEFLSAAGLDVKINDPYKGVELVRRYSDPDNGRHSLQIEINRGLLSLNDPRLQAQVLVPVYDPERRGPETWSEVHYQPIEGRLIAFPGWLEHETQPNLCQSGEPGEDRISISFNFFQQAMGESRCNVVVRGDLEN